MSGAQRLLIFGMVALLVIFSTSLVLLATRGDDNARNDVAVVPTQPLSTTVPPTSSSGAQPTTQSGGQPASTPGTAPTETQPQLVPGPVRASVETAPVPSNGDAADDPAIWINPNDPSQSVIIGTDKESGALAVYSLDGKQMQYLDTGEVNNVDLRYDFPLNGGSAVLLTASNRSDNSIAVFQFDPASRRLSAVTARNNRSSIDVYGLCMYRSARSGSFYTFVTEDGGGSVEQWEIKPDGSGVTMTRVRTLRLGSQTEGCVADDVSGALYIAEEDVGIWRYGAEPDAGSDRRQIDATGNSGHLRADVEGLAIYYAGADAGYLIASSQGNDSYVLYDRASNAYIGTFKIVDGDVDGTNETDGLDVTNRPMGPAFPYGALVVQDGDNRDGSRSSRQDFKIVPWEVVAAHFEPALTIYTRPAQ